jgi:hypothetical protein
MVEKLGRNRRLERSCIIELRFLRRAQGGAERHAPQVWLDKPARPGRPAICARPLETIFGGRKPAHRRFRLQGVRARRLKKSGPPGEGRPSLGHLAC